jgi:hypothetical protein
MIEWLQAHYERLWPILSTAVELTHGAYDKATVWQAIESGEAQLWPAPDAVIVTEIVNYPTGLKVLLGWLAAGNGETVKLMVPHVEEFAARHGCARVEIVGRRGWARAIGYEEIGSVMKKEVA